MPVPLGSLKKEEAVGEGLSKGRWTVVRKIGEGGFAEVYAIKDTLQNVEVMLDACLESVYSDHIRLRDSCFRIFLPHGSKALESRGEIEGWVFRSTH